jgi:hypothetical protein
MIGPCSKLSPQNEGSIPQKVEIRFDFGAAEKAVLRFEGGSGSKLTLSHDKQKFQLSPFFLGTSGSDFSGQNSVPGARLAAILLRQPQKGPEDSAS